MNSFYGEEELLEICINNACSNVLISRKASIYVGEMISIGSNARVDDYCYSGSIW